MLREAGYVFIFFSSPSFDSKRKIVDYFEANTGEHVLHSNPKGERLGYMFGMLAVYQALYVAYTTTFASLNRPMTWVLILLFLETNLNLRC
jgi:hypothetical protein